MLPSLRRQAARAQPASRALHHQRPCHLSANPVPRALEAAGWARRCIAAIMSGKVCAQACALSMSARRSGATQYGCGGALLHCSASREAGHGRHEAGTYQACTRADGRAPKSCHLCSMLGLQRGYPVLILNARGRKARREGKRRAGQLIDSLLARLRAKRGRGATGRRLMLVARGRQPRRSAHSWTAACDARRTPCLR
jgi:hypothetical protein